VLVTTHRWLGIAGGLLFVAWFASGVVMIYARMPELTREERLARQPRLDASGVRVAPVVAANTANATPAVMRLGMHLGRPIYRFGVAAVLADTGESLPPLSANGALAVAREAWPEHVMTARYEKRLTNPDQWTLQNRAFLPLHRVALGDDEGTRVYVAERTGELVMAATAAERRWAYAGAVLHWLYFTPLRERAALWTQVIIWLSVAGCALTLSGIVWGLLRWSPRGHLQADAPPASPYTGLLRWHHYAGLLFGLFSFTWVLSGLLSMDPWSWHPGTTPTRAQREGVAGGPLRADAIETAHVRAAAARLSASAPVRELTLGQHGGTPYFFADTPEAPETRDYQETPRIASALDIDPQPFVRFADAEMLEAAARAMPGVPTRDVTSLDAYDAYYYDRTGALPLPVLRVRYADDVGTWLYLDPSRGTIVRKEERLTRLNRWLYHGLHSLDFAILYTRRPLWDVVVVVLSVGGLVLSATTLLPGWRRVARGLRR
jgi:hypothetical protein